MTEYTYCRLSDAACGLKARLDNGRLVGLDADPSDPVCEGRLPALAGASISALSDPRRITRPLRREGDRLVPATWDDALREIGEGLKAIRRRSGPSSLGLYLGEPVQRSSRDWIRSLAFGVALGTPHIFSELSLGAGPMLRATELSLGHPVPLLPDLGRAHLIVLMGGEQPQTGWGPGNLGLAHDAWINHSKKTKGTKVVVAGPRRTPFAAEQSQYLSIRPGTEPFFLLGLLSAAIAGDWRDRQFVDDYTTGWNELVALLRPWPVERCARICGLDPALLSGVALKFGRAAMAVAWPDASTFANAHAGLGAWAWLTLHTVTANALRPGGLYDHIAPVDLQPLLAQVPTRRAPRTRATDQPLQLLQAPCDLLPDEILSQDEGGVRALLCIQGDPAGRLAGADRVARALDGLELLVCLARVEDQTTDKAHWVLPITHPWEQEDLELLDSVLLPRQMLRRTPALVQPAGEARRIADILRDLHEAIRPGLRRSAWGPHLALAGRFLAGADLAAWESRVVDWAVDEGAEALQAPPYRIDRGEADRATWRLGTADERIRIVPEEIEPILRDLVEPEEDPAWPLYLRSSGRVDAAPDRLHRDPAFDPGLRLHPDTARASGLKEGAEVRVRTRHGETTATLHLDPALRPDVVDIPAGFSARTTALLSPELRDPLCGVAARDGRPCRVEPL